MQNEQNLLPLTQGTNIRPNFSHNQNFLTLQTLLPEVEKGGMSKIKLSPKGNVWMYPEEIPDIYKIIDSPSVPKSANYMLR